MVIYCKLGRSTCVSMCTMPMPGNAALASLGMYQFTLVITLHLYLLDTSTIGFMYHFLILSLISQGLVPQSSAARRALAFFMCVPVPLVHVMYTNNATNNARHTTLMVFASHRESVTWYKLIYFDVVVAASMMLYHKVRV